MLANRAGRALIAMVSDKINQWTLLVGMLPLAMSVGAGGLSALPLVARQSEKFLLTVAQSLFGLATTAEITSWYLIGGCFRRMFFRSRAYNRGHGGQGKVLIIKKKRDEAASRS